MQKWGIDLSKWQKGFNFDKAKAEGVEFVILRGAYKTTKDSCFEAFYKQCKDKGIPVGVYHYTMAKTVDEAKKEADAMLKILAGKQFEYPIYLDVEDKTQKALGKDLLTAIIDTYCSTLENAGYYVGIYSTYLYLRDYTHIDNLDKYDKWIAQWASVCTSRKPYGMWQFGGETNVLRSTSVAGMVVDQNYCYKDYPAIVKNYGLNGFKKPDGSNTPLPEIKPLKSVTEIAQEVIAGKWGVGADRKKRLSEAGYAYDVIQARVNELLKPKKSIDEIAREVIRGKWGTGLNRKNRLTAAGYDYNAVQERVNQLI